MGASRRPGCSRISSTGECGGLGQIWDGVLAVSERAEEQLGDGEGCLVAPRGWGTAGDGAPFLLSHPALLFFLPALPFPGSLPSGLSQATDEPPPSGPSTTQGAQAPILILEHHPLGELKVLGRDKAGRLRVAWTARPDTFAHFQLRMQVAEGPWAHEELLPGDVHQALVPPPPPGAPYTLFLQGVTPGGQPSVPITYQGIMGTFWTVFRAVS